MKKGEREICATPFVMSVMLVCGTYAARFGAAARMSLST